MEKHVEKKEIEEVLMERRRSCIAHTKKIEEMHLAIFGNGDPSHGLVWKVTSNTEFINNVKRIFWICLPIAMSGAMAAMASLIWDMYKFTHGIK